MAVVQLVASDNYDLLVEEGRRLVHEGSLNRWALGDLALRVEPMAPRGKKTGSGVRLEEFAADLAISAAALKAYRETAAAWPAPTRVASVPWSVHRGFMRFEDRARRLKQLAAKHPRVTMAHARAAYLAAEQDRPKPEPKGKVFPDHTYAINIECKDARHQERVYEALQKMYLVDERKVFPIVV